jgi:hypothetical protein
MCLPKLAASSYALIFTSYSLMFARRSSERAQLGRTDLECGGRSGYLLQIVVDFDAHLGVQADSN